jgi:hypothetical protein
MGGAMRKVMLMMLLAVVSSNAVAEWVKIGSSENITIYVDLATIRKTGNKVKMWNLLDLKSARGEDTGKPYMSAKGQQEYDCKKKQLRKLAFSFHSGNMGAGEVAYIDYDFEKWIPVSPGSINEAMWKVACRKQ